MEDLFARTSLCYLTNRCDEGFELIYSTIIKCNDEIILDWEEQKVFCLISIDIIEKRYKSWIHLNHLLVQTEDFKKRQSIQIYIEIILNELYLFSSKIILLIEKYLFKSSISLEVQLFYLKIEGDIHFFLGQTSKFERKIEEMLSALSFYNQALEICQQYRFNSYNPILLSITYNKALVRFQKRKKSSTFSLYRSSDLVFDAESEFDIHRKASFMAKKYKRRNF